MSVLVIENCEDAWNELVDTDVTASLDAADFKIGSGSAKFVAAAGLGAGDIMATEVISVASLAAYTHIGAWIKSSVDLDAGDLQLLLDNTAQCASPLEALDIPAVDGDAWTFVRMALNAPSSDLSLISMGLKQVVDKGAFTIRLDDIKAMWYGTSLRQRILTALDTRLKTILIANGYETDLGQNVFEWRDTMVQQSELPALVWKDLNEDPSSATVGKTIGYHWHDLTVEMSILSSDGSSTPEQMRKCLADVTAAVGTDTTFGGLAIRTQPVPNEAAVEQADRIIGAFRLTINIHYQTKKWNPYE